MLTPKHILMSDIVTERYLIIQKTVPEEENRTNNAAILVSKQSIGYMNGEKTKNKVPSPCIFTKNNNMYLVRKIECISIFLVDIDFQRNKCT